MNIVINVAIIVGITRIRLTETTLCKPLSTFRIDCNDCLCTFSGREYKCTEKTCPPLEHQKDLITVQNKQGYFILMPRSKPIDKLHDDNFILSKPNDKTPQPIIKDITDKPENYDLFQSENIYFDLANSLYNHHQVN